MSANGKAKRSRPLRRLLVLAVCAVAGLELLYLVAANGFLRSEWGRQTLNRKPEKLAVSYQSAWTWLPCVVHVRGLEIRGRARRGEWRTVVDSGRMAILLPSLLRRHFRLLRGEAVGAEIEIRTLPPPDTPGPATRQRPWRISLDGLTIEPLRVFRLDDYELAGAGRATGWAHFQVRGPVELDLTSLSFADAVLLDGGEVAADALRLDGRLRVDPFVFGEDTVSDLLAGLTGTVALEAEAAALGFLSAYLEQAPWLRLGGSGHLVADLETTAGWLAPGSRLTVEGPTIEADLFGLHAWGEGRLVGEVPEGTSRTALTLQLPGFAVSRQSDGARLLEGEELEVVVTNDSNAIDRPAEGLALAVTVPPARVPDLAAYSQYLPEAAAVRITGGSARLEASLRYSATERTGDGRLRLSGHQVEAAFREVDLRADVLLDSRLADARLEDGHIDISGTRLVIDRVSTRQRGELRDSDWWGRIQLPEGRLIKELGDPEAEPALLEARVAAELRDTGPLVALLEQHVPRLAWMDALLTVHDVRAGSRLRLQGPRVSLADLQVTGGEQGRLELLGELDLARKEPSGVFFARWGKLSAAVSLAEGERVWKLTRSRQWYDESAAAYRSSRRARAAER